MYNLYRATLCNGAVYAVVVCPSVRRRNSDRVTPTGVPNRGGVGSNSEFRSISCYISTSNSAVAGKPARRVASRQTAKF